MKITGQHVAVMRELRENGWSIEGIADIYGLTPYAVRWLMETKASREAAEAAAADRRAGRRGDGNPG